MPVKTFEKFEAIALKLAKKAKKNTEELTKLGEKLAAEFEKTGYIRMLPAESMNTDYVVFIPLIRSLLKKLGHKDAVTSPIEKLKDSSWMADASFFVHQCPRFGNDPEYTRRLHQRRKAAAGFSGIQHSFGSVFRMRAGNHLWN